MLGLLALLVPWPKKGPPPEWASSAEGVLLTLEKRVLCAQSFNVEVALDRDARCTLGLFAEGGGGGNGGSLKLADAEPCARAERWRYGRRSAHFGPPFYTFWVERSGCG